MCELIITVDNPEYWKEGWKIGNIDGKKSDEICEQIRAGMHLKMFAKCFKYDRVLVKMSDGRMLVIKDRFGKIGFRKKRKRAFKDMWIGKGYHSKR
jgi:hypothetical protein